MGGFGLGAVRASLAALAAGVLTVAALVAPAAATSSTCASSGKCYLVSASPASIAAGASESFSFAVTNEATTQTLGSIQITAPTGFALTGASGPAGTSSYTSSAALFLNLSLSPGQSVTLTVDATAPCGGASYQWSVEAKQSNQFNGSGNDFQPDPASTLSGTVTGTCSLEITSRPNDTATSAPITNAVGSTGGPVQVEVLDGTGNLATSSTAAVTVTIGANPGSGSLSGTTTVDASGGVATFGNLSIDRSGLGYTLTMSSPGIDPVTSGYFNIESQLAPCTTTPCTASSSTKTTTGTVSTSSTSSSDPYLGVGLGGVTYTCPTYTGSSDPVSFDVLSSSGAALPAAQFSVQLEISKSTVQASGHPGASTWQICYASTQSFTAISGTSGSTTIGGVTYYTGLLPGCSNTAPVAPCLQAKNKDNAGDVIVTFLASGDPVGFA